MKLQENELQINRSKQENFELRKTMATNFRIMHEINCAMEERCSEKLKKIKKTNKWAKYFLKTF